MEKRKIAGKGADTAGTGANRWMRVETTALLVKKLVTSSNSKTRA